MIKSIKGRQAMRRRQIFAAMNAATNGGLPVPQESIYEDAKREEAKAAEKVLTADRTVGQCRVCGKIIGRGLHMHERHCKDR